MKGHLLIVILRSGAGNPGAVFVEDALKLLGQLPGTGSIGKDDILVAEIFDGRAEDRVHAQDFHPFWNRCEHRLDRLDLDRRIVRNELTRPEELSYRLNHSNRMSDRYVDNHHIRLLDTPLIGQRGSTPADEHGISCVGKEVPEPPSHRTGSTDDADGLDPGFVEDTTRIGPEDLDLDLIGDQVLL